MKRPPKILAIAAVLMLAVMSGCDDGGAWKAEVAETYADRQDAQHCRSPVKKLRPRREAPAIRWPPPGPPNRWEAATA